jgi:hypothetical protein
LRLGVFGVAVWGQWACIIEMASVDNVMDNLYSVTRMEREWTTERTIHCLTTSSRSGCEVCSAHLNVFNVIFRKRHLNGSKVRFVFDC